VPTEVLLIPGPTWIRHPLAHASPLAQPCSPSVFQQAWKLACTVPHFAKGQSRPDEGHVTCPESGVSKLGWGFR